MSGDNATAVPRSPRKVLIIGVAVVAVIVAAALGLYFTLPHVPIVASKTVDEPAQGSVVVTLESPAVTPEQEAYWQTLMVVGEALCSEDFTYSPGILASDPLSGLPPIEFRLMNSGGDISVEDMEAYTSRLRSVLGELESITVPLGFEVLHSQVVDAVKSAVDAQLDAEEIYWGEEYEPGQRYGGVSDTGADPSVIVDIWAERVKGAQESFLAACDTFAAVVAKSGETEAAMKAGSYRVPDDVFDHTWALCGYEQPSSPDVSGIPNMKATFDWPALDRGRSEWWGISAVGFGELDDMPVLAVEYDLSFTTVPTDVRDLLAYPPEGDGFIDYEGNFGPWPWLFRVDGVDEDGVMSLTGLRYQGNSRQGISDFEETAYSFRLRFIYYDGKSAIAEVWVPEVLVDAVGNITITGENHGYWLLDSGSPNKQSNHYVWGMDYGVDFWEPYMRGAEGFWNSQVFSDGHLDVSRNRVVGIKVPDPGMVTVPVLTAIYYETAGKILVSSGLEYREEVSSVRTSDVGPFYVSRQTPEAGTVVPTGSAVTVFYDSY